MAKTVTSVASEYEKAITTTKKVFFFKDDEFKIDQLSKEIYLKEDREVHYPTPFRGDDKYNTIKKFVYIGFKKNYPPVCTRFQLLVMGSQRYWLL